MVFPGVPEGLCHSSTNPKSYTLNPKSKGLRQSLERWNENYKGNVGLPFLEYMEKSVSETLGRLVKLALSDWIGIWVALTCFTGMR